jgi:hypothetical protein
LRDKGYQDLCDTLSQKENVYIESDTLREIYESLKSNDFEAVEGILRGAKERGIFEDYINESPYVSEWTKIKENSEWPSERGGHQLIVDEKRNKLMLFGGWDGSNEMGDFWEFDCGGELWSCISENTAMERGPGKRSCHKMAIDDSCENVFVFGRYIPVEHQKDEVWLKGEIYRYNLEGKKWVIEDGDTGRNGGPENIYDHQIVHKRGSPIFYVFGGRGVLNDEQCYSGLYSYNEQEKTWCKVRLDNSQPPGTPSLKGRVGFSLIHIPEEDEFYGGSLAIIGGQRGKDQHKEVVFYKVDKDTVYENEPFPFTIEGKAIQRTVLNEKGELVVLFSYSREKDLPLNTLVLYTYSISHRGWRKCMDRNVESGSVNGDGIRGDDGKEKQRRVPHFMQDDIKKSCGRSNVPNPRTAHQFVFNRKTNTYYLFGGNSTDPETNTERRTSDLWKLKLSKKSSDDILKKLVFIVRKHKFLRLIEKNEVNALEYFQTSVYEVVDHSDPLQVDNFRKLCCELYRPVRRPSITEIIDEIGRYFPEKLRPPTRSIQSFV